MTSSFQYLFGPVPSRRFGRSLGIDVTPMKTCSFDCVFCQLGRTTQFTTERSEFVPFNAVCAEIEQWLKTDGKADVITFAGSGEPTLYSRLGELIDFIKARTELPVILLSNGTLLHRPDVRAEAAKADIVKVSLSAWDEASFQIINRPAPGLTFESLVTGERAFRAAFGGELWLEVFLMDGINAAPEQVQKVAGLAAEIRPDKIHLNTAVRPPSEADVRPVAQEKLEALCDLFTPHAEVIAAFTASATLAGKLSSEMLVELVRRHPATAAQLAGMFGVKPEALRPLLNDARLQTEVRGDETYYICR
jgi:wyosine [tRNA(Phe)-imidazoG37] synthetase (radical SAM superfamily)